MSVKTTKVWVTVQGYVEVAIDPAEASKQYPDSLYPMDDMAFSVITQQTADNTLKQMKDIVVVDTLAEVS